IHRFYSAPADSSGPVELVSVSMSGADASSIEGGSRSFDITVGISGNFQVNKPCTAPPSGGRYTCFTYDAANNVGPDRAVLRRLKQTRGPNTYTIDCGGGNIRNMIQNGCTNRY